MAAAEDTAMAGVSQQAYAPAPPPPPPPPIPSPHAPGGPGAGAEFFLSNYRLGKTLGIGSFGKVRERELGVGRDGERERPKCGCECFAAGLRFGSQERNAAGDERGARPWSQNGACVELARSHTYPRTKARQPCPVAR
jgi:hypothetical protein